MSPELITVAEKIISMGGQAGLLFLATYYLARTLKSQYESRIIALESHVVDCDKHRMELGKEIRDMQTERIHALERMVREREAG